jgi:hypothetical protein
MEPLGGDHPGFFFVFFSHLLGFLIGTVGNAGRAWRGFFFRFFFFWAARDSLAMIGWQLLAVTPKTGDGSCCVQRYFQLVVSLLFVRF